VKDHIAAQDLSSDAGVKLEVSPCPFCGACYFITGRGAGQRAKIMCSKCEATGPVGLSGEASAVDAWNTRSASCETDAGPTPGLTPVPAVEDEALAAKLGESAAAFREHPIYTQDGDPVRLAVQADELDQAANRIRELSAEKAEYEDANGILNEMARQSGETSRLATDDAIKAEAECARLSARVVVLEAALPNIKEIGTRVSGGIVFTNQQANVADQALSQPTVVEGNEDV